MVSLIVESSHGWQTKVARDCDEAPQGSPCSTSPILAATRPILSELFSGELASNMYAFAACFRTRDMEGIALSAAPNVDVDHVMRVAL